VISHKAIVVFSEVHREALPPLDHWYRTTLRAAWKSLAEIRQTFPHADPVGRLTVFDIGRRKIYADRPRQLSHAKGFHSRGLNARRI
jgi:mRNA interferase HigB